MAVKRDVVVTMGAPGYGKTARLNAEHPEARKLVAIIRPGVNAPVYCATCAGPGTALDMTRDPGVDLVYADQLADLEQEQLGLGAMLRNDRCNNCGHWITEEDGTHA